MSKLVGRKLIEINVNDLKNGHIPIYDKDRELWYTTSTSSIAQGISGSKLELSEITASALLVTTDAYIQGRLTATEYYSTVVSSSIIYQSGSTKFGDTLDDTHQFTGSILVDGNVEAPSITGSFKGDGSQLTGLVTDLRISGSIGTDVVSLLTDDLTVAGINGIVTTITDNTVTIDVPVALTSSLFGTASFATIADNITIIDAGIYTTGSESAIIPKPSGGLIYVTNADFAISASYANYASFAESAIGNWNTLINKPLGIVSSSDQVLDYNIFATTGSNNFVGNQTITGSLTISGSATLKNIGPTIFSGSLNVTNGITGSINYNNITEIPEGLVSSSGQIVDALPQGLVSSSTQVVDSLPSGLVSSSTQLPAGLVSSSTQVSYTELSNLPQGLVSSSNQIVAGLPVGTVSSSVQLPNGLISSSTQLPSGIISSSTQLPSGLVSSSTQLPQGLVSSSEQINTGSFSGSFVGTLVGTLSGTIESASYATTASYALVAVAQVPEGTISSSTQVDYNQIENQPTTIATSSYVEYGNVANKPTLVSASSQISYAQLANVPSGIFSSSAQLPIGILSSSTQIQNYNTFATTASNVFKADQIITGSLYITNELHVLGSSSISYISQSTLNIGTNLITVNAQNPSVRFGGLAVIDSASSPRVSGSLLFDSAENQWLFVHQNQATVTSSILLMGPETYNNIGNETHPTTNRVMKSINDEHLGDSQITDDGTTVSIPGNLSVTGIVSGSQFSGRFTGSLSGTATTASYALPSGLPSGLISGSTQIVSLGTIRLTVGTTNKNSGAAFYFNSNTVTAGDSSAPGQDTAFLISSTGLSTVTVYLRQSAAGPNNTIVGVAKNANGTAFSGATLITSSSLSLTANTIQTYTFSGLTLNQFDAIHIYVDPTSAPTDVFGVVIVS